MTAELMTLLRDVVAALPPKAKKLLTPRLDLVAKELEALAAPPPPASGNPGVSRFWEQYRKTQGFLVRYDNAKPELIIGWDVLSAKFQRTEGSLRNRLSIARNSLEITCRPEGEMYAQPAVLRKLTHEETEQLRAQGMAPIVPRPYDPRVVPSTQKPLKARQTDKRGGLR